MSTPSFLFSISFLVLLIYINIQSTSMKNELFFASLLVKNKINPHKIKLDYPCGLNF